jgi:hypothetical protein
MGLLYHEDIETDDEGEVVIERGDFKLAHSERTAMQLANFILLTDYGDYTPDPTVGANLVEFMGHPNIRRTHILMLKNMREALRYQGYFDEANLMMGVEPIDINEAGIFVHIIGDFGLEDEDISTSKPILGFRFPFPSGELVKADLDVGS